MESTISKKELSNQKIDTESVKKVISFLQKLKSSKIDNYSILLPLIFRIKDVPVTMDDFFPFKVIFERRTPIKFILKTGRQCGKTTTLALLTILRAATINNLHILVVYPLHESVCRFSKIYVYDLLKRSPILSSMQNRTTINNVLQRELINGSKIFFSYAFFDVVRTLGISADNLFFDEVQDFDPTFIPIITETLSASKYGYIGYCGTARSYENTIEKLWSNSSMAEFIIPCSHCTTNGFKTWNIPSTEFHLIKMIGPYRDDISEERPGLVCYKCQKPLNPRLGNWVHKIFDRKYEFAGYHVPQVILPMHYASPKKWHIIKQKQSCTGFYTESKFYNEVLGESYDSASGLVSYTDILRSCSLHVNSFETAKLIRRNYIMVAMGIDWGGGGEAAANKDLSLTAISFAGMSPVGNVDVFYYQLLPTNMSIVEEATYIHRLYMELKPDYICHDFNGRGEATEELLIQNNIPRHRIIPYWYVGHAKKMVSLNRSSPSTRPYRNLSKSRSLTLLCTAIKNGKVRFAVDKNSKEGELGIPGQFLNLVTEVRERTLQDVYVVLKRDGTVDDFVHATNFAVVTLWCHTNRWPQISPDDTKLLQDIKDLQI